jgi:hypothetical protein
MELNYFEFFTKTTKKLQKTFSHFYFLVSFNQNNTTIINKLIDFFIFNFFSSIFTCLLLIIIKSHKMRKNKLILRFRDQLVFYFLEWRFSYIIYVVSLLNCILWL